MYGLSKNVDLSFFIKKELIQISIGLYQIILNFDDSISVSIEGKFNHIINGNSVTSEKELPSSACSLLKLLGKSVTKISNDGAGTIELYFSKRVILKIFDSEKNHESYTISTPKDEIIV